MCSSAIGICCPKCHENEACIGYFIFVRGPLGIWLLLIFEKKTHIKLLELASQIVISNNTCSIELFYLTPKYVDMYIRSSYTRISSTPPSLDVHGRIDGDAARLKSYGWVSGWVGVKGRGGLSVGEWGVGCGSLGKGGVYTWGGRKGGGVIRGEVLERSSLRLRRICKRRSSCRARIRTRDRLGSDASGRSAGRP